MIQLTWAEVHTPLFVAGFNLGLKLDTAARLGLTLAYDRDAAEVLVGWNGKTAIVPVTNVACMIPADQAPPHAAPKAVAKKAARE